MITLFNRKRILTSTSMEDLGRFKMILSGSEIPYLVKTIRSRGTIGSALDAKSYASFNLAYSDRQTAKFVYYLYVRRQDFQKAKVLV